MQPISDLGAFSQVNQPPPFSSLLALMDRGPYGVETLMRPQELDRAVNELLDAIREEAEACRLLEEFPFPDLWHRCRSLPPEEGLLLCIQFFVPLSKIAPQAGLSDRFQDRLSDAIAHLTRVLGVKALQNHYDYLEIHAIALQVRDLLNCSDARDRVLQQLQSLQHLPETGCFLAIAKAQPDAPLYREAVIVTYHQNKLNPIQGLDLVKRTFNHLSNGQDSSEISEWAIGLAVYFGHLGIASCETTPQFENLAQSLQGILDSYSGSRPLALQALSRFGIQERTALLRTLIEREDCRKAKFLEALVTHLPSHFLCQKSWNELGVRCMTEFDECPVRLWVAVGAHGSRVDVVLRAAAEVCGPFRRILMNDPWSRSKIGQLIANIPDSRNEARALKEIFQIQQYGLAPTVKYGEHLSPMPPASPLLKLLNRETDVAKEEINGALRQEILACRAYLSQGVFPFPVLLEKCRTLSADRQLDLCARYFERLAPFAQVGSESYEIISKSIAKLAIGICNDALTERTDCLEILGICQGVHKLLHISGGRVAAFNELRTQRLTPAGRLVFEIASSSPTRTTFHELVVLCACWLKGFDSVQSLYLSRHYLRSMSIGQNDRILEAAAAQLAVTFGVQGVNEFHTLSKLMMLTKEMQLLLDSFSMTCRHNTYERLSSFNDGTFCASMLYSVINSSREIDVIESIALDQRNLITTGEWNEIGRRCRTLGEYCPKRLLIGAAANGSLEEIRGYAIQQFQDWSQQDILLIKGNLTSLAWLDQLMERGYVLNNESGVDEQLEPPL
jgi:hypothetical protein